MVCLQSKPVGYIDESVTSDLGTCVLKFRGRFYVRNFQTVVDRIVEFIGIFSGIMGYISFLLQLKMNFY